MIDRAGRDRLALHLRRLATGRITNDDYNDEYPIRSVDAGIDAVSKAGWSLYSDTWTYRLRGRNALGPETFRAVARCILFLHSDQEYEWSPDPRRGFLGLVLALITLGRADTRDWAIWRAQGHYDVWPFLRRADFDRAAAKPRFLTGGGWAAA